MKFSKFQMLSSVVGILLLASIISAPAEAASTKPGSPTKVTATAGYKQAVVSWKAPASNGGSPITSYMVTSSPTGLNCETVTTTCTVQQLVAGTTYSFKVTATNRLGKSAPSVASAKVKPSGLPIVTASSVNLHQSDNSSTAIRLQWKDGNGNGSAIDQYVVTASPGGATCSAGAGQGNTCVVSGLNSGSTYSFTITAHNANGWSTASGSTSGSTLNPSPLPPSISAWQGPLKAGTGNSYYIGFQVHNFWTGWLNYSCRDEGGVYFTGSIYISDPNQTFSSGYCYDFNSDHFSIIINGVWSNEISVH
jgi:hypothetical protein